MLRRSKRKMELVEADQEVLAYRDTSTNTLFTWTCAPMEPIRIFRHNKPEMTYNIFPVMQKMLTGLEAETAWQQWGTVVGCFRSFCENFAEIEKTLGANAAEAEVISSMEKELSKE